MKFYYKQTMLMPEGQEVISFYELDLQAKRQTVITESEKGIELSQRQYQGFTVLMIKKRLDEQAIPQERLGYTVMAQEIEASEFFSHLSTVLIRIQNNLKNESNSTISQ